MLGNSLKCPEDFATFFKLTGTNDAKISETRRLITK